MFSFKRFFNSGVNYDYIVAIKLDRYNHLHKIHFPIRKYRQLKNDLYDMLDDNDYDVIDMKEAYSQKVPLNKTFDMCIHHGYNESYIDPIISPQIDIEETKIKIAEKEREIIDNEKEKLKQNFPQFSKKMIKTRAHIKSISLIREYHHRLKYDFLSKCAPYIEALAYKETFKKICDEVVFISTERHGWKKSSKNKEEGLPSWEYEINDDIRISLWSNFCYGNSSCFMLRVYYKNIMLCPYSEFVTYRYANATDIIKYTRKYYVERESWNYAADFVVDFCNKAIYDPEEFVKKEIVNEIKELVNELTKIASSKELYLENAFSKKTFDTKRFSGIQGVTEYNKVELANYNENPHEYEILFRMEKISGALAFLESIEQFTCISRYVRRAIVRIEDLNINIYPELIAVIEPLSDEVEKLFRKVQKIRKKKESLHEELKPYYEKIKKIRAKYKDDDDKDSHEESFRKRHKEIKQLEDEYNNTERKYENQKSLYNGRKNFLDRLEDCRNDIEDSGILERM